MNNSNDVIVVVVNKLFVKYANTLIHSIKQNWTNHPSIIIFISPDVSEKDIEWLKSQDKLKIIQIDPLKPVFRKWLKDSNKPFYTKEFHDVGFFWLSLWGEEYNNFDRILVLDADMLVLKPLDNILADENFIGVSSANTRFLPVFSFEGSMVKKFLLILANSARLLLNGVNVKPYYSLNSGVICIRRKDRAPQKFSFLLKLIRQFRSVCMSDQELILLWMMKYNKKISNDFRFNFQARFYNGLKNKEFSKALSRKIETASNDIHIIHFNGPKPDSKKFLKHPWTSGRSELVDLYYKYAI